MRVMARWGVVFVLALVVGAGCGSDPPTGARSQQGNIVILNLRGTPYQMGVQHGELMAPELAIGADFINNDAQFSMLLLLAQTMGFIDEATAQSFPYVVDECRGMVDGANRAGVTTWTFEMCVTLAWGDVILENLAREGIGCSQFMATGAASTDGSLVHGRTLDWDNIRYMIEHPTIIVREPQDMIPYLVVGFPGNVAPYSGMNERGLSIASNDGYAMADIDRTGRSHAQMVGQILQECGSLEEAEAFLRAQDHTTAEILGVADGTARAAASFEMSATHFAVRRLSADGVVYMTNHFVDPDAATVNDPMEPTDSSLTRYVRLAQLLEPGDADSRYGTIDLPGGVAILRDTYNPVTDVTNPPELFDTGGSLANNGAIHSMVFLPEQRVVYVALGEPPVPQLPFVGFSLDALLGRPGAAAPAPAQVP
jgi:hypothetical protein